MLYCYTSCTMSLSIVRIWQSKAVSHLGTVTKFKDFMPGGSTYTDLNLLTKNGSLGCAAAATSITIQRTIGNTAEKSYFEIDLGFNARISRFLVVTWQEEAGVKLYVSPTPID